MGSIALTMFSISMILFQLSCKKEANAQTTTTSLTQLNKLIYSYSYDNYVTEIWTSNYDGTNQTKVNITLPTGVYFTHQEERNCSLSPDGKKIFFLAGAAYSFNGNTYPYTLTPSIYSCDFDGSNVVKVINATLVNGKYVQALGGAY